MRKIISIMLSLALVFSLGVLFSGCKDKSGNVDVAQITQPSSEAAETTPPTTEEETTAPTTNNNYVYNYPTKPTKKATTRPTNNNRNDDDDNYVADNNGWSDQSENKKPTNRKKSGSSPSSIVAQYKGENISSLKNDAEVMNSGYSVIESGWDENDEPTSYIWNGVKIKVDPETGEIL